MDTTAAVCNRIGSDRVGVRISPMGTFNDVHDPEPERIYQYVAKHMSDFDLAYLHVIRPDVSGSMTRVERATTDPLNEIRSLYRGTIIAAGDLDAASADGLVSGGVADGVAFGRWFISNPDLPQRLRHGWPIETPDRATFYTEGPRGYVDFPNYSADVGSI